MKSNGTGKLDKPQDMCIWYIGRIISSLIADDAIEGTSKHGYDHTVDQQTGVKHLTLLLMVDHVLIRI